MPYALNGDVKIHYEVRGEGLPILLHPGGLGDLSLWEQAGYVTGLQGYKCILMDPRGHGSSDYPESVQANRVKDYVSDVIAVLDQLGIYRCSFFGYSNGGRVGFALGGDFPGRVTSLITLGSCVDSDKKSSEELAYILRLKGVAAFLGSAEAEEHTRFPAWLRETFLRSDPEMFALEVEAFADWEGVKATSPRIKSPTLILTGGREDPNSECLSIAGSIPTGAQLVVLRDLGHIGAFLRSDMILPHVRDFLSRVQFGMDRRYS